MKSKKSVRTITPELIRDSNGCIDVSATLRALESNPVAVHAMVEFGKAIEGAKKKPT